MCVCACGLKNAKGDNNDNRRNKNKDKDKQARCFSGRVIVGSCGKSGAKLGPIHEKVFRGTKFPELLILAFVEQYEQINTHAHTKQTPRAGYSRRNVTRSRRPEYRRCDMTPFVYKSLLFRKLWCMAVVCLTKRQLQEPVVDEPTNHDNKRESESGTGCIPTS